MNVAVLVLCVVASPLGHAPEAAFLDEIARRAYRAGHYREALATFLEVQTVAPSKRNTYNAAVAAELAGEYALAHRLFTRYLETPGQDVGLRHRRAQARRRALAPRLALLSVSTDPAGARVHVDRRALGVHARTPTILALEPGRHRVIVDLDAHQSKDAYVEVERGRTVDVQFDLERRVGRLTVRVRPAVDGRVSRLNAAGAVKQTLPIGRTSTVPIGRWRLRVEAPDFAAKTAWVDVTDDRPETRIVDLGDRVSSDTWLLISGGREQAELHVDGVRRGNLPARIRIEPGARDVVLKRGTDTVWRQRLSCARGRSCVVWVAL